MKSSLRFILVLAFVLSLAPGAVLAQSANKASDPFVELHERLAGAAESSLAALRVPRQITIFEIDGQDTKSRQSSNPSIAGISLSRVNAAQANLLRLQVDAARIFAEEGVPLELLVVAGVESGFNPLALSPKGARGPWQLMPATAERFGLRVDERADERIHPVRSTRAAAQYLRELYAQFGDWLLALAAYNAGEQRVAKAIERSGSRDFWQLSQGRFLPEETRRYVPAVLNPKDLRYGFRKF